MPRHDVAERLQHRLLDAGMLALQVEDQPLDPLPLKAEIAAGRAAAADDRQARTASCTARASSSSTYTSGRMTTCSPLSETSRAGIALSAPAKNRFRSSVSMKSSR